MLEIRDSIHDNELLIWACECRNNDQIMVILADRNCSNVNDMFDEKAWKTAKYFNVGEYDKAVNYTFNVIKKQFDKNFIEEYNTKFKMHKCLFDLQKIATDSNELVYEDYYNLATLEDVNNLFFCDLIINNGKLGLRYSKYNNHYHEEFENLTFEEWNPDLTSNETLMLGMQGKLKNFIESELDYEINIGIGV